MSWSDVCGHEEVIARMRALLASGRLPHALLVTGSAGAGKRTLAKELTAAALCLAKTDETCGACRSCKLLAAGAHPDFVRCEVPDSARAIPIAAVRGDEKVGLRGISRPLAMKPVLSERVSALIPDADRMTEEAQNALLKTVEEPPGAALVVLTSARPAGLLATVRSRCARVRLAPLPAQEVERYLVEKAGRAPEEARLLADASGGLIGAALGLSGPEVARARGFVVEHLSRRMGSEALGEAFASEVLDVTRDLSPREQLAARRHAALRLAQEAAALLRRALALSVGAPASHPQDEALASALAERAGSEGASRALEALAEAELAVQGNSPPGLVARVLGASLAAALG